METMTIWMAFIGGLLSFLSPCILPVAPGYLGIISGASLQELGSNQKGTGVTKRKTLAATGAFVLGFTVVFVVLGLSSSYLGQMLRANRTLIAQISGVVVILLGLHQAGWLPITWLYRERRINLGHSVGLGGAFLTGLAFSLGWTPCVGPILAAILAVAGSQAGLAQGFLLLTVYSLGLALPFLLLALAFEQVSKSLNRIKPYLKYLEWASGLLLIGMGLLLLTGGFRVLITWLMRLTGGWTLENLFQK
ncbi:MAG TPA: cytochrome c biogenesis protein CcdA [Bacillota bacterium]|nr:cytochrome c biogenesis protein CcdA [Bacillota bacterium]